jgi:RNA polymerase sigma-70 factor (ECF subfamily)
MTQPVSTLEKPLDRYRSYLILLARTQLNPRLGCPVDASDIVQQTLLEAHAKQAQFRGTLDVQRGAWLRQILAHNLADALRGISRAKRDLHRQQSLESSVNHSALRLGDLLAADQSAPGDPLDREERAVLLADALAELPEAQREALVMQYWQGMSLAAIAAQMSRTPAAVAGLLKRALKQLRQHLSEPAPEGAS